MKLRILELVEMEQVNGGCFITVSEQTTTILNLCGSGGFGGVTEGVVRPAAREVVRDTARETFVDPNYREAPPINGGGYFGQNDVRLWDENHSRGVSIVGKN